MCFSPPSHPPTHTSYCTYTAPILHHTSYYTHTAPHFILQPYCTHTSYYTHTAPTLHTTPILHPHSILHPYCTHTSYYTHTAPTLHTAPILQLQQAPSDMQAQFKKGKMGMPLSQAHHCPLPSPPPSVTHLCLACT